MENFSFWMFHYKIKFQEKIRHDIVTTKEKGIR